MTLKQPLYIAEKPDMASKIAQNLPGPHKKMMGYIETGAGNVTWAIGHLLEQVPPEEYDEKYSKWIYADLPIFPSQWKVKVSSNKSKQVGVIRDLLKSCSDVVNAGDPGREGQLIVDEILEFLKNKKPVWRLTLNSLDAPTVQKALANLEPNQKYTSLYQAALGRQRADWLVGMNLTRAYTLLGKQAGYQGVLSVGRVQTPTLYIVVLRENEIKNFVPQKYFQLTCTIQSNSGQKPETFVVKYLPPKNSADMQPFPTWLDQHLRLCDESYVQKIVQDVQKSPQATVTLYDTKTVFEKQPLPFKLSNIQSKINAKMGIGVDEVLEACQSLYQKGYASYPRTDCTYLPPAQLPDAPLVLNVIAQAFPELSSLVQKADPHIQSPAWNESKLGEHHAIIPTTTVPDITTLTPVEKEIYLLISQRYLAQFFPECEVSKVSVEMTIAQHLWQAKGRTLQKVGWREIYGNTENDDAEDEESVLLPVLQVGDQHQVQKPLYTEKWTTPPPRYTQGTLLDAMEHVHRLVNDPVEKKKLQNVEGIGRAATRANIIATLLKRGFLHVQKKYLLPSDNAIMLVNVVNKHLTDPGLTARWEQALDAIATGQISLAQFQQKQEQWLQQLIGSLQSLPPAPVSSTSVVSVSTSTSTTSPSKSTGTTKSAKTCPKCGKPMIQRTAKSGKFAGKKFWGCTGYPQCTHSDWT